jgi:hypothetical protein
LQNVLWRLSPGFPHSLSNPSRILGKCFYYCLGDAGSICKVRCINSFILVCESKDTNQTHRDAAEVKHCAVKDWMGSSLSKQSLLNSKAENLFAFEGDAAVAHGQDLGVAL